MWKKIAGIAAMALALLGFSAEARGAQAYTEAITPNKLAVQWLDRANALVELDTFRIRGYNVAQLRSLVEACGGTVLRNADETYQIVRSAEAAVAFTKVSFSGPSQVKVQYNVTSIRDMYGRLSSPSQPGWVYLVDYQYNWGSLRDILDALNLELVSFQDDPANGRTAVSIREKGSSATPSPTRAPTPTPTRRPATPTPTRTPTPTPTPALLRYDLRSKPMEVVMNEIPDVLDGVMSTMDDYGRIMLFGVTKANVEFSHDSLTWVAGSGNPIRPFSPGAIIPAKTRVEYTYIGNAALPQPTLLKYGLDRKPFAQVLDEIKHVMANVGSKAAADGKPIIYGTAKENVLFTFDYKTWVGFAGNPLKEFATDAIIPKGSYLEYTYIGTQPYYPTATPTPSATPKATPSPTPPAARYAPQITMLVQHYSGANIIEVPQFTSTYYSSALDSLNQKIQDFAGNYRNYMGSANNSSWIEIKAYPLQSNWYTQIVMTRVEYPNYGTYGDVMSFVYDWQRDREYALGDVVKDDDLDLINPETKFLNALPGGNAGNSLESFRPAAFIKTNLGSIYFYNVVFKPVNNVSRKDLYIRYPDGSFELYNGTKLRMDPVFGEMIRLNPALYFEK
ncbi:MAG: hypothetical protein LBU32_14320 [Clostridiales bacterium]|jgi:hypothetical protein|nr:hypothetical protein [Clostridiales bacterium]